MTEVISVDISEFQPAVDNSYRHEWLIFRVCDGDYIDPKARDNLAWAEDARAGGSLRGFTVYVVFRPGKILAILGVLDQLKVPNDCVVMIDAESWNGQIGGDHSTELNALAVRLRVRQQGRSDLVWAYGNRGPDLAVWPNKPPWLRWVVASYGGSKPNVPNMAGWQYTDGQYSVPGYPNSSAPFGRCDHNILYNPPEADMPLTDADVSRIVLAVMHQPLYADGTNLAQTLRQIHAAQDPAKLAAQLAPAIAAKMPAGSAANQATIEAAVRAVFADAANTPGATA